MYLYQISHSYFSFCQYRCSSMFIFCAVLGGESENLSCLLYHPVLIDRHSLFLHNMHAGVFYFFKDCTFTLKSFNCNIACVSMQCVASSFCYYVCFCFILKAIFSHSSYKLFYCLFIVMIACHCFPKFKFCILNFPTVICSRYIFF